MYHSPYGSENLSIFTSKTSRYHTTTPQNQVDSDPDTKTTSFSTLKHKTNQFWFLNWNQVKFGIILPPSSHKFKSIPIQLLKPSRIRPSNTKTNQFQFLNWNQVKFDLQHWKSVNIDHPDKHQAALSWSYLIAHKVWPITGLFFFFRPIKIIWNWGSHKGPHKGWPFSSTIRAARLPQQRGAITSSYIPTTALSSEAPR